MLVIFGGLPATGKSTISKRVARELGAAYIRLDTIEQALKDSGFDKVYGEGYEIAYKLAAENLSLGLTVIADCVNPIELTRSAWRAVGDTTNVAVLEFEIVCSDQEEHRRRVETRVVDIEQSNQVTWKDVIDRSYEPWLNSQMVIDTAAASADQSVEETLSLINSNP